MMTSATNLSEDPVQRCCPRRHQVFRWQQIRHHEWQQMPFQSFGSQLILHRASVTTPCSLAPGYNGSISKNSSESVIRGLDLLHILQPMLYITTVSSIDILAPGYNGSISKNSS